MQETQEMRVRSLGQEDPLQESMATHSSILAGESPKTEEPGGLQFTVTKSGTQLKWLHSTNSWRAINHPWASLVVQSVKSLPAMQETQVRSLGQEDPLEKWMATHSSILTWKIPWTEEPDGLQSIGSQRVEHNWVTNTNNPYLLGIKSNAEFLEASQGPTLQAGSSKSSTLCLAMLTLLCITCQFWSIRHKKKSVGDFLSRKLRDLHKEKKKKAFLSIIFTFSVLGCWIKIKYPELRHQSCNSKGTNMKIKIQHSMTKKRRGGVPGFLKVSATEQLN